jgi:hypothetical protein
MTSCQVSKAGAVKDSVEGITLLEFTRLLFAWGGRKTK